MNRIVKMAIKDLKLLARDKMGAFFIFGFPILMGLFFGMMYPGAPSSNTTSAMKIVIVDHDRSEMSGQFIESLNANSNLDIDTIETAAIDAYLESHSDFDREQAEIQLSRDQVRLGRRAGTVMIPKGFGERAGVFWGESPDIHIGMDDSRGAEKAMMEGFVMEAMGGLFATRFQEPTSFLPDVEQAKQQISDADDMNPAQKLLMSGFLGTIESLISSADEIQQSDGLTLGGDTEDNGGGGMQFANIIRDDVTQSVDPNSQRGQLQRIRSKWDISFPQAMLWGVLGCVAGFAISIAKERSEGTMVRLQVAPLSKLEILLGKALACFAAVLLVTALLTLLGYALGMRPLSYPKLVLAAVSMAVCFVGIMMTMSVLGKTEQSVSGSGWAINMVMAMLGGCMIPVMFMPSFMQNLSFISPIRWAIQAIEGAVWRDFTWTQMLTPCAILVAVGLVGLAIGTKILSRD
jgi:ABC-2 type transport system permease protein